MVVGWTIYTVVIAKYRQKTVQFKAGLAGIQAIPMQYMHVFYLSGIVKII
jgi:hypothetical protein